MTENNHNPDVTAAMQKILAAGSSNEKLIHQGRYVTAPVMLRVDDTRWLMQIVQGRVLSLTPGPFVMPSVTFTVASSESEWLKFWKSVPPPGSQDLFALLKRKVLTLDGDLHPLMSNLFYFKFLLAAPRQAS